MSEQSQPPAAPPAAAAQDFAAIQDFAKLDLRTAEVLEVREHPNADKLYLLRVKVGEIEKQIVAGVRAWFSPEDLQGKTIVIVNNLQPAKLRGETSEGMMLAVRSGEDLAFLTPNKAVPSGLKVS